MCFIKLCLCEMYSFFFIHCIFIYKLNCSFSNPLSERWTLDITRKSLRYPLHAYIWCFSKVYVICWKHSLNDNDEATTVTAPASLTARGRCALPCIWYVIEASAKIYSSVHTSVLSTANCYSKSRLKRTGVTAVFWPQLTLISCAVNLSAVLAVLQQHIL